MSGLNDLLEGVRKASGGVSKENYDLNVDLGKALLGWRLHEQKAFGDYDTDWAEWRDAGGKQIRIMPDHINSIDVAIALAEHLLPHHRFAVFTDGQGRGPCCLIMVGDDPVIAQEFGKTLPLAVLAALLSALIAKESSNDQ